MSGSFEKNLSVHHRLRQSVEVLSVGKGRQYDRIELVLGFLRPLRKDDFPVELQGEWAIVERFRGQEEKGRRPSFREFACTLVKLYGESCAKRGHT